MTLANSALSCSISSSDCLGAVVALRLAIPPAQHFPDNLVPVRMMPFDADEDPEQALQVEIRGV